MNFIRLILTNTRRHRIRTLIGVAGIAFGVAAMMTVVTLLQGAVHMFERILNDDSEVIVFEKHVSDLFFSNVPLESVSTIKSWPMVKQGAPALFGLVSSVGRPMITCFGVTEDAPRLKSATWLAGSREGFDASSGVVLGSRAAEFMNVTVGDDAVLGHERFPVVGIVRTQNGFEDGGVFMPLTLAQSFFHKDGVASIASFTLTSEAERRGFIERVESTFPNLAAMETETFSDTYSQFRIVKTTAWAVGGCAFLLGGMSVANTMMMSVFGRIREIAILRVSGFSPAQIAGLIFGESTVVALLGVLVGIVLGVTTMFILRGLPLFQGYVDTRLHPWTLGMVVLLAFFTGLAGALYPAFFATRIHPAQALRYE